MKQRMLGLVSLAAEAALAQRAPDLPFRDPALLREQRVNDLIS